MSNEVLNEDYEIFFFADANLESYYEENPIFIYREDNFIQFELLNSFLVSSASENEARNGMIQCGNELSYFLKLSKDITEIPNNLDNHQFKYMLILLKFLKAVENKNFFEFYQALICQYFFHQNDGARRNEYFDFEKIFNSNFLTRIDFSIKKNIFSTFLNSYMINYEFHNGNLILFENSRKFYDVALFDENIPFKNLLITDFRVFCILENILKDTNTRKIFKLLLNETNIKSLIINSYKGCEIFDRNLHFFILSIHTFKSIVMANFIKFSLFFISKLKAVFELNIEYLSLKNIVVSKSILGLFLKKGGLKGLVLYNVNIMEHYGFTDVYSASNETLHFIDFKNVFIGVNRWNNFFSSANVSKIILLFRSIIAEEYFLQEFKNLNRKMNVVYFKAQFCFRKISKSFIKCLNNFEHLKTLKLKGNLTVEKDKLYLCQVIENMKKLKYLEICQLSYEFESFSLLLKFSKIKALHLENIFFDNDTLLVSLFENNRFLIKLVLKKITISQLCLEEIFKLENLKILKLQFCTIKPNINCANINFNSKNINYLNLDGTSLEEIKNFNIFSQLDSLEYIYLWKCNYLLVNLSMFSFLCNLKLKIISYEYNDLYFNDLNRIKKIEVLEELILCGCKFNDCSFCNLGNDCGFFNSLVNLNLSFVRIKIEDLIYLKNFKNLTKISIELDDLNLNIAKFIFVSLPIIQIVTNFVTEDINYNEICRYLNEKNIEIF
ncbi:hypothetical protein CWI36_0304p0010 [Hamiltosporidium magnivora]|uniref:Uncharacterized protein n=1 Tax=Hamiltosporidium magnivora TaxID=148818 RepID=A0A4Q9LHI5_9MICR|nr:hypothetical protein CWI36_0304p0010 [Hamiltosporidium magnivora]